MNMAFDPEPVIATPALRYHGAKFRLAPWVMSFFPDHRTYVEPFGGAAGVLIQKRRAYADVYNDLDGDMVNFFTVVRDADLRERLIEQLALTPYARDEFAGSTEPCSDPVERARRTCVRAQMGFGSAGATKSSTGFRVDTAREYGTSQSLWVRFPDSLAALGRRMSGVLIENQPALDCIAQHDRADTLHFVDPPYMHSVRKMGASRKTYRHEMSDDDHAALIEQLRNVSGMVVLSGYDSGLYADLLGGWTRHETQARISAGRGTEIRTEVVWLNPACQAALDHAQIKGRLI